MEKNLPKISIVTPSFNQGRFIEETIKSVLSQNYPNLEYLVMDGGSTDETLKILKKYGKKIIWISEKDKGQSDAINKGLRKATGEIVTYLNTDDVYYPGALLKVGKYFRDHKNAKWLTGRCRDIGESGENLRGFATKWKELWLYGNFFRSKKMKKKILLVLNYISQPATFWRREMLKSAGFFDETLHFSMDYEYWLRLYKYTDLHVLHEYIAMFRIHSGSKSSQTYDKLAYETNLISKRYTHNPILVTLNYFHSGLAKSAFPKKI